MSRGMVGRITSCALVLVWAAGARADEPKAARLSPLPVVSYAPETSLVLGAAMVATLRLRSELRENPSLRPSSIETTASYSFERQGVIDLIPSVYLDGEAWRVGGKLGWQRFPQRFWGVAERRRPDAERYTEDRSVMRAWVTRRVVASLRLGLGFWARHRRIHELDDDGLLQEGRTPGARGGWETGPHALVVWDDRDNNFATQRGGRYAVDVAVFSDAFGGDYDYRRLVLDLRHFVDLAWGVFAAQIYVDRVWGDAPFRSMPTLGGEDRMRGFFRGRYVDRALLMGQMEYRLPLYWRFGAAMFFGLCALEDRFSSFGIMGMAISGGAGLRFAVDERDRVNIRFDVAHASDGSWNLYLALGEAF